MRQKEVGDIENCAFPLGKLEGESSCELESADSILLEKSLAEFKVIL